MKQFNVNIYRDTKGSDVPMWLAVDSDVPGLKLENFYLENLIEECEDTVEELLDLNCSLKKGEYSVTYKVKTDGCPKHIEALAV